MIPDLNIPPAVGWFCSFSSWMPNWLLSSPLGHNFFCLVGENGEKYSVYRSKCKKWMTIIAWYPLDFGLMTSQSTFSPCNNISTATICCYTLDYSCPVLLKRSSFFVCIHASVHAAMHLNKPDAYKKGKEKPHSGKMKTLIKTWRWRTNGRTEPVELMCLFWLLGTYWLPQWEPGCAFCHQRIQVLDTHTTHSIFNIKPLLSML